MKSSDLILVNRGDLIDLLDYLQEIEEADFETYEGDPEAHIISTIRRLREQSLEEDSWIGDPNA